MSGYTDHPMVRRGVVNAGVAFLQKPFTPDRAGLAHPRSARSARGNIGVVAPLLVADRLHRTYLSGPTAVDAVSDVSLEVARGEFVAIVGPSGCGKSTLLHLCGAMDRPSVRPRLARGSCRSTR